MLSKEDNIKEDSINEFNEIFNRIPGIIVHPYKQNIEINNFYNSNAYKLHIDFVLNTQKEFLKYDETEKNKNNY